MIDIEKLRALATAASCPGADRSAFVAAANPETVTELLDAYERLNRIMREAELAEDAGDFVKWILDGAP